MKMMMKNREQRLIASLVNEKIKACRYNLSIFCLILQSILIDATIIWEMIQKI